MPSSLVRPLPSRTLLALLALAAGGAGLAGQVSGLRPEAVDLRAAAAPGPGFILEAAGSISAKAADILDGRGSIVGRSTGERPYAPFLRSDPSILPLEPGRPYRVSFSYRILESPDRGFEVLFYSPTGGSKGSYLPSRTIFGKAGDSGRAELANTLGPWEDYRAVWNLVGRGAVAIDGIELRDGEGRLLAFEDGEPSPARPAQANLPGAVAGRPYWAAPGALGGRPPYRWTAAGAPPPGLSLSPAGELAGIPERPGRYVLLAELRDAEGARSRLAYRLEVRAAPDPVEPLALARIPDPSGSGAAWLEARPRPYLPAFANPLKGFRPEARSAAEHPYATLGRQYIEWNLLERNEADGVERIKRVTDILAGDLPAHNVKLVPRVYLAWPPDRRYWPADLEPGDFSSPAFRARMRRLIARLGEAWDGDPRIAYVETGIIGDWGEQHHPAFGAIGGDRLLPPGMEKEFGDAYLAAFPRTLLMHRNPRDLEGYPFGIHWDVFGATRPGHWANEARLMVLELSKPGWSELWRTAPMGGEVDPKFLGRPDFSEASLESVLREEGSRLADLAELLHWNHVGLLNRLDPDDAELGAAASRLQDALGYRLLVERAAWPARASAGGLLELELSIRNRGASPLYYPWPLELSLLDPETRRPAWKALVPGVDPRAWQPGVEVLLRPSFRLPAELPAGRYLLALAILDPAGMVPSARFAVESYFAGGRTPLGPLGIDAEPGSLELGGFDDLAGDRSLYYLPPR